MIKYDGNVVYQESDGGIRANTRLLYNEAQVIGIKSIFKEEVKREADFGVVYVVKDVQLDEFGKFELIRVFEKLHDAQRYAVDHPRAVIMPREVIKHGKIKEQK